MPVQLKYYGLLLLTLVFVSLSHATTFYVDNSCANNGNGTASTCAASAGAAGPWNTIKNALQVADCGSMSNGDILEIKGHTSQDRTCQAANSCYHEDNINIEGNCGVGITIQNRSGTHVVIDGTVDIKGSTWTSIGSGVYQCSTSGCSGDVGDAFAFRAWYRRGTNPEEELDLIQTNITCDTTLPAGKMKINTSTQSICVHLSDGSSPAAAAYFRVPWYDPALQAGADTADNITLRKNPAGGSFRIQRYRKRGIEANALANTGWTIDGLEWAYMMDRCVAYSDDEGTGGIQIVNNTISYCGQEGIRVAGDAGSFLIEGNTITDIQTSPVFERCSGIGTGCLSEFTDNGTGIRLVNHQGAGGIVRNNVLLRMGGGMNNRARMINFEHDNKDIIVERNYLAHASGLVNTGAAIMWSGSFNLDTNDGIIVRNNLIYDVDRCFWVQYGTDYDSQSATTNYILNNHCVEFEEYGIKAEASGSALLDGVFQIKNNVFRTNTLVPTLMIDVQSANSTGWQTFQNNIFECDSCAANQDIISWRGTTFERDADCTTNTDCIDQMTTILGATYTGQKYGDINVDTAGGTEPDLTIAEPSEAMDAGQALTTLVPDDYTGAARPAVYDAGAYNITGAPPPPAGEDLDIAVQRFSLSTASTGIQDFSFDDFSMDCTQVNCAAIFVVTKATENGTEAPDAMISLGFTDGLNSVATSVHDDDNVGTVDSRRYFDTGTGLVVRTLEATGTTGLAEFFDWSPSGGFKGLRLNITDGFPAGYLITVVIMGGVDFEAKVGAFAGNLTVNNTTDVTSVGFLADAVLLSGGRLTTSSASTMLFTVGAAVNDGSNTQGSIGCYSNDGASPQSAYVHALTSTAYAASYADTSGQGASIEVGSFDSSGFTATTRVVGTASNFGYLALRFGGADSNVIDMDTRTSTGTQSHALAYKPLFGMVLGTLARAYDTDEADSDGGACMISFVTPTRQFANTTTIDYGTSANTQSASFSNGSGVVMPADDGTCVAGACFTGNVALNTNSMDVTYTSVFTSAVRKWIGFTVQDVSTPGGGGGGSRRRGAGTLQ